MMVVRKWTRKRALNCTIVRHTKQKNVDKDYTLEMSLHYLKRLINYGTGIEFTQNMFLEGILIEDF